MSSQISRKIVLASFLFGSLSLTVASPTLQSNCSANSSQVNSGNTTWPWLTYKSSNATPPTLSINRTGEPLAPLPIFLGQMPTTSGAAKVEAPFIMRDTGNLVWQGPVEATSNFRTQTLDNASVITFWSGSGGAATAETTSFGYGQVNVLDTTYSQIHTICPQLNLTLTPAGNTAECEADVHESYITPRNTILVTAYNTTTADLSSVGGPTNGWVLDPLAVELDIKTGEILFIWSPLEHVPVSQSQQAIGAAGKNLSNPYDWFHMNSIQSYGDNYLINGRNVWTTYLVNKTGDILWEINGYNGGDFGSLPKGGTFSWEHHARIDTLSANQSLIHWFANDNGVPTDTAPSFGLALILTLPPNPESPPTLYTNLSDPLNPVTSFAEGSYTILPNGNYFMGYGMEPYIKEYDPGSSTGADVRWSARFGASGDSSYRAYKSEWHATPTADPSLVVANATAGDPLSSCVGSSSIRGYVSWNGATDVQQWAFYIGDSSDDLSQVQVFENKGFETEFVVPATAKYIKVGAIESTGRNVSRYSTVVAIQ